MALLVVLVLSTGVLASLSSHLAVARFTASAAEVEVVAEYRARLDKALEGHEKAAHGLLGNGLVSPEHVLEAQREVEAELAAGLALFDEPDMHQIITRVDQRWRTPLEALGLWGPAVLTREFRGADVPALEALAAAADATSLELLELDVHAREHFRHDVAYSQSLRTVAVAVLAGLVGLALIVMAYFARRMSTDVVGPTEALQEGVRRLRNGELGYRLEVPSRKRENELTELGRGFNEMGAELASVHESLLEAQRVAAMGSWAWDLLTDRVTWSDELYRLFGLEPQEIDPTFPNYLERVHPEERSLVQEDVTAALAGDDHFEFDHRIIRPDQDCLWLRAQGRVIRDRGGAPLRVVGTCIDVTGRKLDEQQLVRLASTDSLTGLANRERFGAVLQQALKETDRTVGLLLLDLDGFKDVNDGLGHHTGDLVLQDVARRVQPVLRGGDELARLGGDEFAVVLAGIGDVEHAIEVATEVLDCLAQPFDLDGVIVHVGGSIGIAVTAEATSPGELLKRADVAMYRAKTLSTGWAVFEPDHDDIAAGRLQMVIDLRHAIDRDDLDVAYQPILHAGDGRVTAFEALARWHHPTRGIIPPDQFIPLAEQADLIVPLTRLVLRKAAAACAKWRNAGHDVRVGVNLSVQVLRTEDPTSLVRNALAEAGLDPVHLVLEITESSLATEGEQINELLNALRALGVTLVIDDFGTGYSAMSYLKRLPVAELKIDRSFVRDIAEDDRDHAIVRSLIDLAHSLSLAVVAEGVETFAAFDVLTRLGCDYVQGYAIARPMPEAETQEWLSGYMLPPTARPAQSQPTRLLIVDDDRVIREWLSALGEAAGWHVRTAASAEEALIAVDQSVPDVVILDHCMPGMTGAESVPHLRGHGVDGPILLFTRFLNDAIPGIRVPLDVWPVSKDNPDGVFELLDSYRKSANSIGNDNAGAREAGGESRGRLASAGGVAASVPHQPVSSDIR